MKINYSGEKKVRGGKLRFRPKELKDAQG